jgi:hypothetical protein
LNLRGANLSGGSFQWFFAEETDLRGADLSRSLILESYFGDALIDDVNWNGAEIDGDTIENSGWSPETVAHIHRGGAIFRHLEQVGPDYLRAVLANSQAGLTLYLSTKLMPWDQTMLHAFVCSVLGTDTDVRVAEYIESGHSGCRVRLTGGELGDLERVAQHLAEVTWKTEQRGMLQVAGLLDVEAVVTTLDYIRDHLHKQELWAEQSGTREMLEDQAEAHIQKKDVACVRTWENKLMRSLWGTATKKVGKELSSDIEDGVRALIPDTSNDD